MKKSFILHLDSLDILDDLTNEEAGLLFKAIKMYQKGEIFELPKDIKMAFLPFKNQFIRDLESYENRCKVNASNGSKGGKRKVANASNRKQNIANLADNDSDSKKDSDNESKSENKKDSIFKTPEEARRALEENFKDLVVSSGWLETVCMTQKITMPQVLMAIEDFKGGCLVREEYKSLKELKDYFSYWLPKNRERLFQKPKTQEYSFKPKRI